MSIVARLAAAALAAVALHAWPQDERLPPQREFLPKAGSGRVVVLISGETGTAAYAGAARQIADAGFDVVLVDGNDVWSKHTHIASTTMRDLLAHAQAGAHAQPGKVGVVGFSLGGAAALTYAARMPGLAETVVAVQPYTTFVHDAADFVARIKVPTLMLAGSADTYRECCLIAQARELADAARSATPPLLTLHEYAGAGHGITLDDAPRKDRAAGRDAMARTIAQLRQALPPTLAPAAAASAAASASSQP